VSFNIRKKKLEDYFSYEIFEKMKLSLVFLANLASILAINCNLINAVVLDCKHYQHSDGYCCQNEVTTFITSIDCREISPVVVFIQMEKVMRT
jgi:hypothetical protein